MQICPPPTQGPDQALGTAVQANRPGTTGPGLLQPPAYSQPSTVHLCPQTRTTLWSVPCTLCTWDPRGQWPCGLLPGRSWSHGRSGIRLWLSLNVPGTVAWEKLTPGASSLEAAPTLASYMPCQSIWVPSSALAPDSDVWSDRPCEAAMSAQVIGFLPLMGDPHGVPRWSSHLLASV